MSLYFSQSPKNVNFLKLLSNTLPLTLIKLKTWKYLFEAISNKLPSLQIVNLV